MAKKTEAPKTVLERVYNVPLRKEYMKAPNWKRTPKAAKALREFISKHMKSDKVVIGKYANLLLWKHGIKRPPHHIKVNAVKDDKGKVIVELVDLPGKAKREEAKKKESEKKAKEKEAKKEALKPVTKDKKEEKKEKTAEEAKKEQEKEKQKEELKELKKEHPKQPAPKPAPQQKQVEQHPTAPKSQ